MEADRVEQARCVIGIRHDVVARVLEQAREPLPEEGGVLGDHEAHGNTASMTVPRPTPLSMNSRPP